MFRGEEDDHALRSTEMSDDAYRHYRRFRDDHRFKQLLKKVSFVPFAIYLR